MTFLRFFELPHTFSRTLRAANDSELRCRRCCVAIGTAAAEHVQDVAGDCRYLLTAPRGALQHGDAVPQQRARRRRDAVRLRSAVRRRAPGQPLSL